MKRSFNLSLGQTVTLSAIGGLIMASTFPLIALFHLGRHGGTFSLPARLILSFSPLVFGFILSLKATDEIKDGIANERWAAEKIATFRDFFESTLWFALCVALLIGWCGVTLFVAPHQSSTGWFLLILLQSLTRLAYAFKQPRRQAPPDDWRSRPALHSQQWGQR